MKNITLFLLVFLLGCMSQSEKVDKFSFKNININDIYVNNIKGLRYAPPVGSLRTGQTAISYLAPAELPDECVVNWAFISSGKPSVFDATVVDLRRFRNKKVKELLFTFSKNGVWLVEEVK